MPDAYQITPFRDAHAELLAAALVVADSSAAKTDILTVLAGALGKAVFILSQGDRAHSKAMFSVAIDVAAEVAGEMHAAAEARPQSSAIN